MRVFLAFLGALSSAAGAAVILCNCGEARSHGWWPGWDASARIPAEASVGGFGEVPGLDAGCIGCPPLFDDAGCPLTWAAATTEVEAGVTGCPARECAYPEGTCVCFWGCAGPGQRRTHASGAGWSCVPVTPDCPSPRPMPGTPCGDSGAYCNYGPACCEGSWFMECADGLWGGSPGMFCP
jgi:hypothetical protein